MKYQFNHDLVTSMALWFDNRVLNNGQGYINIPVATGYFQPEPSRTGYCWAFPYRNLVFDSSVSGATVMSGIYNSAGQFLTRASGVTFDYLHGRVFSPANLGPIISGTFSRNEYNVYVATPEELDFYLEKTYNEDPNILYAPTGVSYTKFMAPCVILTDAHGENKPFAFGGQDLSNRTVRAFIISNNPYNQEAIVSLMTDSARSYIPLITSTNTPLTSWGDIKGGSYNYVNLMNSLGPRIFIEDAYFLKMNPKANKNKTFLISIVEFDTSTVRYPRREN